MSKTPQFIPLVDPGTFIGQAYLEKLAYDYTHPLIGAGIAGLGGGALGYFASSPKNKKRNALLGLLGGAGLGALGGHLYSKAYNDLPQVAAERDAAYDYANETTKRYNQQQAEIDKTNADIAANNAQADEVMTAWQQMADRDAQDRVFTTQKQQANVDALKDHTTTDSLGHRNIAAYNADPIALNALQATYGDDVASYADPTALSFDYKDSAQPVMHPSYAQRIQYDAENSAPYHPFASGPNGGINPIVQLAAYCNPYGVLTGSALSGAEMALNNDAAKLSEGIDARIHLNALKRSGRASWYDQLFKPTQQYSAELYRAGLSPAQQKLFDTQQKQYDDSQLKLYGVNGGRRYDTHGLGVDQRAPWYEIWNPNNWMYNVKPTTTLGKMVGSNDGNQPLGVLVDNTIGWAPDFAWRAGKSIGGNGLKALSYLSGWDQLQDAAR